MSCISTFGTQIVRSEDLGYDDPVKVRLLGVDLVAFRDTKR